MTMAEAQEVKPHHARTFQASVCVMSADMPLSKASHMAKHNFKGTEKYTYHEGQGDQYLLKKKSDLPFYFSYFR